MTRKEFEHLRFEIRKQKFTVELNDPIKYSIARAVFKQQQLKQLIAAGKTVKNSKTVEKQVQRMNRVLRKAESVSARCETYLTSPRGRLGATVSSAALRA